MLLLKKETQHSSWGWISWRNTSEWVISIHWHVHFSTPSHRYCSMQTGIVSVFLQAEKETCTETYKGLHRKQIFYTIKYPAWEAIKSFNILHSDHHWTKKIRLNSAKSHTCKNPRKCSVFLRQKSECIQTCELKQCLRKIMFWWWEEIFRKCVSPH